ENQFPANFRRPFLGLLTNSSDSHTIMAMHHSMNYLNNLDNKMCKKFFLCLTVLKINEKICIFASFIFKIKNGVKNDWSCVKCDQMFTYFVISVEVKIDDHENEKKRKKFNYSKLHAFFIKKYNIAVNSTQFIFITALIWNHFYSNQKVFQLYGFDDKKFFCKIFIEFLITIYVINDLVISNIHIVRMIPLITKYVSI
ncbi:hypothetical protein BpHYR1_005329, partial [Brachionus plicatilis]